MADQAKDLAQQYLDIIEVILVVLNTEGDIVLLNRKGHEVLEYPQGALIGENWIETCLPEREKAHIASVLHQLFSGDIRPVEYVENFVLTRTGRERLIAWHNTLLQDESGNYSGSLGSGEDITERKRAEELTREKAGELEQFFNCALDLLCIADTDGNLLRLNREWENMLGYSLSELEGRRFLDFVHPDDLDATRTAMVVLKEQQPVLNFTNRYRCRDGSYRWIEWRSMPRRNITYSSARDITSRRTMEEQLRETQRQAIAANRAKTEFLTNISHEIRTPMTAVLGFTELLMNPDLTGKERQNYLETIQRNGKALLALINEILDLSKIEAGKMTVEPVDCPLRHLIDDVLGVVHVRAQEKGLRLDAVYEGATPEIIHADAVRLRQILVNLAGNAIKFTERGAVRIAVRLADVPASGPDAPHPRAKMQFAVSDTGIGIAPDTLDILFQPFTQADPSMTRRFGGTGLGLAISKRLAKLLGGDIEVTSDLGRGSTFTLTVDVGLVQRKHTPDASPDTSEAKHAKTIAATKGRVLLAEDAPDIQALLAQVFRGMNLEIVTVANGLAVCEKALQSQSEEKPFDLILMDVQMPGRDGLEATRWLREHGWQGPIIALTAHAMPGDQEKCLAAGCNDYLPKTTPLPKLRSVVARHLSQ